jgi:hypothetical protein
MNETHFNARCRERGITSTDPDLIFRGIKWAIERGRDDLCKMVMRTKAGRFWRFRCPEGIYYVVTGENDTNPRTVLTQDMMRNKKYAKKKAKKGQQRP